MSDSADLKAGNAPANERHDFLVTLLKESRYRLIDFMFQQAAILTLVLGWLLSSGEAHQFIKDHEPIRVFAIAAIGCYFMLLIFWTWAFRQRSGSVYQQLLDLSYMPMEFYSSLRISKRLAFSFISAHFILCGILITCLLQLKGKTEDALGKKCEVRVNVGRACGGENWRPVHWCPSAGRV